MGRRMSADYLDLTEEDIVEEDIVEEVAIHSSLPSPTHNIQDNIRLFVLQNLPPNMTLGDAEKHTAKIFSLVAEAWGSK
jgi:hypothetical protein